MTLEYDIADAILADRIVAEWYAAPQLHDFKNNPEPEAEDEK